MGNELVLIVSPVLIAIDRDLLALAPIVSITRTVKLDVPVALGVPLITPVEAFKLSPAGSDPLIILQVFMPLPPDAASV